MGGKGERRQGLAGMPTDISGWDVGARQYGINISRAPTPRSTNDTGGGRGAGSIVPEPGPPPEIPAYVAAPGTNTTDGERRRRRPSGGSIVPQPVAAGDLHGRRCAARCALVGERRRRGPGRRLHRAAAGAPAGDPREGAGGRALITKARRASLIGAPQKVASKLPANDRQMATQLCNISPTPDRAGGHQLAHGHRDRRRPTSPEGVFHCQLLRVYYNSPTIPRFLTKQRKTY